MLAIGAKEEYYDAVWVKNEWGRYLSMMADDKSKHLIPCYKDLDAYNARIDYATITITYRVTNAPIKEVFLGDYGKFLLNLGKTIVEFLAYSAPFVVIAGAGIGIVVLVKKTKVKIK